MEKQMVMKKFTAALVLLGMIIGTAACSSDNKFKEKSDVSLSNYDDYKVEMSVEVVRNRKLMVNLVNNSDRTYMYGRSYTLEYQKNGEWYKVPMCWDRMLSLVQRLLPLISFWATRRLCLYILRMSGNFLQVITE